MNTKVEVTQLEPYILKGSIKVIDRFFSVPLDYAKPDGQLIRIFVRNLIPLGEAKGSSTDAAESDLPYLLYLQGGPGFGVNLSLSADLGNAAEYMSKLHKRKYQTLWLDPRGTGLSTPITADIFQDMQMDDDAIAKYFKHFRADNIVRDCETIRHFLLDNKKDPEARKWTILGQSFGGFCAATYLSFHSDGLKEVFIAGGIPPMVDCPDAVYEALVFYVVKVEERNKVYYGKYPKDVQNVRRILSFLASNNVVLPNGGNLTVSRWLQLGMQFGSHGGIDRVHQLVFRAITDLDTLGKLSYGLLDSIQGAQSFDTNPIYAVLHEPIYCQGKRAGWSAHCVIQKNDRFVWEKVKLMPDDVAVYFTGEMDWPMLYDKETLKQNKVKVNAATYVDFGLVQQTASVVGNVEQFITNQSFHDGIRKNMEGVLTTLFELSKRERD
ncbi:alpha/beta-hydrolase [Suillus clintonianus]|uniref:alpha/beta-hydrolase n=1 Tax=Suillus clintonianus TaxID=1904413 RepID=UPI001B874CAA|nr:alpha/beta-hydrolase [Suillus clintonianus]KAG2141327.1 alpha/beta-hydrolase [Suillus clintonianus]